MKEILTKENLEDIFIDADVEASPVDGLWRYTIHHKGFHLNSSGDVVVDLSAGMEGKGTSYSFVLSANHPADSIEDVYDAIYECENRQNIGEGAECLGVDAYKLSIDTYILCRLLRNYLSCFDDLFDDKRIDTTGIDSIEDDDYMD